MRLVVIDDDPQIGRTIQLGWPESSDTIEVYNNFEDARTVLFARGDTPVDCVVLDLHLPDASGSTVLSEIRRAGAVPVLMLSGWGDADFRADLLHRGADDYLMKPVSVRELHARVMRLVSRSQGNSGALLETVKIGSITFSLSARRLSSELGLEALTEAETALLSALAYGAGRPVQRGELYLKTFGRPYREGEKALETYVGRLRQKLSLLGEDGETRLQTVRGVGYRLAPIKDVA